MAAALAHPPPDAATPSAPTPSLALPPLPFVLDLTCPVNLPVKPGGSVAWPLSIAGPSSVPDEDLDAYITRRYYETLYLGETLFPLSGLVADLERCVAGHGDAIAAVVSRPILNLGDIETRHRRTLPPVVAASMTETLTAQERAKLEDAARTAGIDPVERDVIAMAVDLRFKSRVVSEGERVMPPKAMAEEFERREVLIHVILLLIYRCHRGERRKKKRKRGTPPLPTDDPDATLELLADRIGVWQAVAELGIGLDAGPRIGNDKDAEPVGSAALRQFWDTVLVPSFLPRETAFCASFHLKVFGKPIPAELVPQKKPRKPKVTRRLAVDTSDLRSKVGPKSAPPATKMQRSSSRMSTGQQPHSAHPHSVHSPPADRDRDRRRSASRASDDRDAQSRFSRSSSTDPAPRAKPSIVRAPSGKDLFKGREVGLLRRSASLIRQNSQTQPKEEPTRGLGLIGRRRKSDADQEQQQQRQQEAETLIFATPAKPKYHLPQPAHGGRHSGGGGMFGAGFYHPTPIREEPSSAERWAGDSGARSERSSVPSFVAETPVAHRHMAPDTPMGAVTERRGMELYDLPESEDDDLGDLMVPTDDEDLDEDEGGHAFVPETPRR